MGATVGTHEESRHDIDVQDKKTASTPITTVLADNATVMAGMSYATHYFIDAMLMAGMNHEARTNLENYWGIVRKAPTLTVSHTIRTTITFQRMDSAR